MENNILFSSVNINTDFLNNIVYISDIWKYDTINMEIQEGICYPLSFILKYEVNKYVNLLSNLTEFKEKLRKKSISYFSFCLSFFKNYKLIENKQKSMIINRLVQKSFELSSLSCPDKDSMTYIILNCKTFKVEGPHWPNRKYVSNDMILGIRIGLVCLSISISSNERPELWTIERKNTEIILFISEVLKETLTLNHNLKKLAIKDIESMNRTLNDDVFVMSSLLFKDIENPSYKIISYNICNKINRL